MTHATRVVTVEIAGQRYPIRSSLDERYVAELAAYVESRMRVATESAPNSDLLGLAILVALNVADELFRLRAERSEASGELNARALRLERIVDEALSDLDTPPEAVRPQ